MTPGPSSNRTLVYASLCALLMSLDTSVNIAFPAITANFRLEVSQIQWVVVSYVLTYAGLLLGCGRMADLWGHGRVLAAGLLASAAAFLLCGVATSFGWFLAFRVLQGVGAALVLASAPALVTLSVPAGMRGRALGIFQMSVAVGFALGPCVGGVLVDGFGWRAVYLFRVVPALLLLFFAPRSDGRAAGSSNREPFDLTGALTLAGSVAGYLLTLSRGRYLGWGSPSVLALLAGSTLCLGVFVFAERRAAAPVVDLELFRRPAFSIANLLNLMSNCAMFPIWLLVPYYLVNALGYSAIAGGVLLVPNPLGAALAAPVAGRLSDRIGTGRLSTLGLGIEALGLWAISRLGAGSGPVSVILALGLVGFGLGVFQVPNLSFVMGAIPRSQQGVAGGMTQMMRTLGVVIGVTAASLLFDARRAAGSAGFQGFVPAFQDVFVAAAAVCLAAFGLSLLRGRERGPVGAEG